MLRRRVGVSAGVLGTVLAENVSASALTAAAPAGLAKSTVQAALLFAAGKAAAVGGVSAQVFALAEGVLKTMLISKLVKTCAIVVLAVSIVGTLGGLGVMKGKNGLEQAVCADSLPQKPAAEAPKPPAARHEVAGVKLHVTALPDNPEIMLGEPTFVSFKVANQSDRNRRFLVGGDYQNRLGRPDSFKVEVVGADGKKVPQPDAGWNEGGKGWVVNLPAKGDYAFQLFLPDWATFEKPGTYTITIGRELALAPDMGVVNCQTRLTPIEVNASTTITVVPKDATKLGKIIARLGDKMLDLDFQQVKRAQKMLAAIHDERVIPFFVALAAKPAYDPRFDACTVLGQYNNDEAFGGLKKLARTTGADIRSSATTLESAESGAGDIRNAAALAIANSSHPKAIPFLWTLADDRHDSVRLTVLHKAAELKTPEARAIIQKMKTDKSEEVRKEALCYFEKFTKEELIE